ncbi:MAG: hypothetical protein ABL999_15175 [Pyrinomonadaceae bacterium]
MNIIGFAICIDTDEENDFVPNKLYPVLKPLERDPQGHLRIVDESGEDYLYPEIYFQIVQLAPQAKESLLHYFELSAV